VGFALSVRCGKSDEDLGVQCSLRLGYDPGEVTEQRDAARQQQPWHDFDGSDPLRTEEHPDDLRCCDCQPGVQRQTIAAALPTAVR
jgi:hypothetical protein